MDLADHKKELIEKIWYISNAITGFALIQSVAFLFILSDPIKSAKICSKCFIVGPAIIGFGVIMTIFVSYLCTLELKLRKELPIDQTMIFAVKKIVIGRISVIIISQIIPALFLFYLATRHQ